MRRAVERARGCRRKRALQAGRAYPIPAGVAPPSGGRRGPPPRRKRRPRASKRRLRSLAGRNGRPRRYAAELADDLIFLCALDLASRDDHVGAARRERGVTEAGGGDEAWG